MSTIVLRKRKTQIHMTWDNPRINNMIPVFKEILKTIPVYKIMIYVLIGFKLTIKEDLHRIESLRALARYVNHKAIFKSTKWKDFKENLGWN